MDLLNLYAHNPNTLPEDTAKALNDKAIADWKSLTPREASDLISYNAEALHAHIASMAYVFTHMLDGTADALSEDQVKEIASKGFSNYFHLIQGIVCANLRFVLAANQLEDKEHSGSIGMAIGFMTAERQDLLHLCPDAEIVLPKVETMLTVLEAKRIAEQGDL